MVCQTGGGSLTTGGLRWPALALAVCFALPTVLAGVNDDAGTGTDAGETRATALVMGFGASYGSMNPSDVDVFSAPVGSGPECVALSASANNPAYAALTLTRDGDERTSVLALSPGATAATGIVRGTRDGTFVRFAPVPNASVITGYQFQVSAMTGYADPSTGDALSLGDAGQVVSEALQAPGPCFGGRLTRTDFLDTKDAYLVPARAGETIRYSLATSIPAMGAQLTLLDARGAAIGSTVTANGVGEAVAPTDGTYVLMMSSSSTSTRDLDYLVGWGSGPDPNGCRPYCM